MQNTISTQNYIPLITSAMQMELNGDNVMPKKE